MLKKMFIFCTILVSIVIVSQFVILDKNKKILADNPYQKTELHPKTIEQLTDKNYKNVTLPKELTAILQKEESVFVYFYTSTCTYCKKATPILVPMTQKKNIDLKMFNLLEFQEGWDDYKITKTPTIVHYQAGTETGRLEGLQSESDFERFLSP